MGQTPETAATEGIPARTVEDLPRKLDAKPRALQECPGSRLFLLGLGGRMVGNQVDFVAVGFRHQLSNDRTIR